MQAIISDLFTIQTRAGFTPDAEERTMNGFSRIVALLVISAMTVIAAAGCNTVKGAGKDIQKGGEAVEDAAESVEK